MSKEVMDLLQAIANIAAPAATIIAFFALLLSFIGIVYAAVQLREAAKANQSAATQIKISTAQLRADNERFQQERAVEVLREWTQFTAERDPCMIQAVRLLNDEELKFLLKKESFSIHGTKSAKLCDLLGLADPQNEKVSLTARQVTLIRAQAITYLNALEWCLAVWKDISTDSLARKLIFDEFKELADIGSSEMPLAALRRIDGGFKRISEFEKSLQAQKGKT